jgi:DNA-binding protein HU-beta
MMSMTTKSELVSALAEEAGTTKAAAEGFLDALGVVTQVMLKHGNDITLPKIGKLSTAHREARTGRNPQTGEAVQIAARKAVKFKALKELSSAIA